MKHLAYHLNTVVNGLVRRNEKEEESRKPHEKEAAKLFGVYL